MTIMPPEITEVLLDHLSAGMPKDNVMTLHTRSKKRGGLLRLPLENGGAVILKVWLSRNVKERIKSAIRLSNGYREWYMHRFIHLAGIETPQPLWFHGITLPNGQHYEVMAIEDLGQTESGVPYLKRLMKAGQEEKITIFEERVIEVTSRLFDLRIYDVDNQFNNFLVDSCGRVVRIDFECASRHYFRSISLSKYAAVFDVLLRSHLHAAHPESDRTRQFILRLADRLSVSKEFLRKVDEVSRATLRLEREKTGIDYRIELN